ncbi:thioredoxin [Gluconobacter sp. R75690]|uniref:thioredoxin n=1 Tax=Gluconobacter TaxID=441 RepID=UPI00188B4CB6|nr:MULTISPECIES: thioredoxin [unclassified Gluconobacter]MBF0850974.1 thioredoxin [Gluconobacter sp. R75690]MBF0879666.1 thioredoxin [Gluconobacter sp. R75828]
MSTIIAVSEDNFDDIVLNSELPVVVDFWAPWCSPCKQLMPILDDTAETYAGEVVVVKVNADENPAIIGKYHVRGLPTVILFSDGEERERFSGLQTKSRISVFIDRNLGG